MAWSKSVMMEAKVADRGSEIVGVRSKEEEHAIRWLVEDEDIFARVEMRLCTCVMRMCTIQGCCTHWVSYHLVKFCLVIREANLVSIHRIVGPCDVSDGMKNQNAMSVDRLDMAVTISVGEDWRLQRNVVVDILVHLAAASSSFSSTTEMLDFSMACA